MQSPGPVPKTGDPTPPDPKISAILTPLILLTYFLLRFPLLHKLPPCPGSVPWLLASNPSPHNLPGGSLSQIIISWTIVTPRRQPEHGHQHKHWQTQSPMTSQCCWAEIIHNDCIWGVGRASLFLLFSLHIFINTINTVFN